MSDVQDNGENKATESQREVSEKRTRKPTAKGIVLMIEKLQKERTIHFKKASTIKADIATFLSTLENVPENGTNVQQKLRKFKSLCQNAFDLHNTLLTEFPLPEEEQKRQEEWFQSRRSVNAVANREHYS